MPLLSWRKRHVGPALRNQLVLADAAETMLCATLAATTLLGPALFAAFGWLWGRSRRRPSRRLVRGT
jgi:hypothetical protein